MKKILFVCLGNICRSPMGEGVFKYLVTERGLLNRYHIDSAGTSPYHVGEKADERMRNTAKKYGIELTSKARQVALDDFDYFDLILAMDRSNYNNLEDLALTNGKTTENIKLMREFDPFKDEIDVPDPYYGGAEGFENVYEIMHRSCINLLNFLEEK